MFRGFKEKLSNEYEKAKANIQTHTLNLVNNGTIGQLSNTIGENKQLNDGVTRIRRTDSATSQELQHDLSRTDTPKYQSEPGFSLVDLDDESDRPAVPPPPPPSYPAQQSISRLSTNSDSDSFFRTKFSNMVSNFMPQSDIESEYESESANPNLDVVSKEQLLELCYRLKDRSKKYRERWNEVVKAYRQTIEERDKVKNVLSETQDKAIRRISELKEQCNLEQEAKRHLEENLQVTIEEKEEQIKVLQTKLELVNNSQQQRSGELIEFNSNEKELETKIDRLESLLVKSNESLKSSKEKLSVLTKENESLLEFRDKANKLEAEIELVKKLKDSASTSFSEAKQKLHDELESRKIIIKELKDQNDKKSAELKQKNAELKSKNESIKGLNEKIVKIEKIYENEKSTLIEELSRGKTSALNILREEYEQKIKSISESYETQSKKLSDENENLKGMLEKSQAGASDSLRDEIVEMEQQLEKLRDELHVMVEERNAERELFDKNKVEFEAAKQDLQTKLEGKLNEMNISLELKNKQIEEYSNQLVSMEKTAQKIKESEVLVEELKTKVSQLEKKLAEERDRYAQELDSRQLCTTADTEKMEKKLNSLHMECRVKSDRVAELEKSLLVKDSHLTALSKEKWDLELQLNQKLSTSLDSNKQLKLDLEKSTKKIEVTKKLMDKLREDNASLHKTIDSLQETNNQLMNEKKVQKSELSSLSQEVVGFKNKLIDIFYSEYADGQVQDIATLNYFEFLDKVQSSYQKRIEESVQLQQRINQLDDLVIELRGQAEISIVKERQHLETLKLANEEMTREIERLRSVELRYGDLKDDLEQRTAQLTEFEDQVQCLTADLLKTQESLKQSNKVQQAKDKELEELDLLLNQIKEKLSERERQIDEIQSLQQEKDDFNDQHEQLLVELSQIRIQRDQLQNDLKLSSQKCDDLCKQLAELTQQNSSYSEKIAKIKSNTKEILESKHKLEGLLRDKDSEVNLARKECQQSVERTYQLQHQLEELQHKFSSHEEEKSRLIMDIDRLKQVVESKEKQENEAHCKLKELESKMELSCSENQSKLSQVQDVLEELRKREELCTELEEKLKLRDTCEQELRTEIIALEEKLKLNIRGEKELKEEMKINEQLNESLKEQVHRYLADISELRNDMNTMKAKHEETVDKLYKQLEVRESQLDESLMNANSQYNSTAQDLLKSKTEISRLSIEVEELSVAKRELENRLASESLNVEEQLRKANTQYQCQIELLHSKLEEQRQEIAEKMDQFDNQESQRIAEHKKLIGKLESEIVEKNVALEEVHEYYQQRLKAKDNELKHLHEQLTSTDRNNYQINALQNSILQYHEENSRLKELISMRQEKSNSEPTSRSRLNSDIENCAILGVHLPQPTEYEYLRNILFEFMMGREPVTLAKVIAAVMRFSNDQTDQIIRKQESIHVKHGKPS